MNKKLINVLNIALVCIVLVMVVVLYYTGKKEHFIPPQKPYYGGVRVSNENFMEYADIWF